MPGLQTAIPVTTQTPQGQTKLITDPMETMVYRLNQETDVRTAVARGLKEYLEQLSWNAAGGRLIKLVNVFDTWTQAEEAAKYPSAAVVAGDGEYDASSFTPVAYDSVEGIGLIKIGELKIDLQLSIYATDNKQRAMIVAMLESALSPVDWMYGMRLELPHYFSSRATYEPSIDRYEDTALDAIRRFRRATTVVRAATPVLRVSKLPFFATGQPSLAALQTDAAFGVPGGGISPVFVGSVTDIADLVPPRVTGFVVPATNVGTTIPITAFTATDNIGVTGYMITESSAPPLPTDFRWTANRPTSFTAGGTGTRTLYAWAKDAAGNVSAPATATCVVS